ncbi:mitochondrial aspartate-glutamate transporter agc1 [Friedmanniomyces endolithicus]|uniref:Mitochondrial aspartate-glutamate transporter AGC1 n=1 Tax=Friedmanniomyces endolithicus TaxID=329885 RepID=A0AAN6FE92_9PEZI|nr:mitochondrial aspartate-glutamate transporter agc1 [Friedmanniomyces endolithicus]KAK0274808.1 mitochondrial aspartate-glutamate transporter agc1 [Friedmanniomyces endolithicus]KAK0316084.1 mitochondrial aspartate-glutamate transporter agc1 [Friedmanniomyces endolithicus]KAK0985618.1 mitochondrial aspartate-glutamate transporter agc1 [Friedmanniomyces endolithicus]
MATVVDQVKETLVGTETGVGLSAQTRSDFLHNAIKDEEGELYMSEKEFVDAIAPEGEDYHKIKREQYSLLFSIADRNHNGRISIQDWSVFNNLLAKPDAEYDIAFRLFADPATGQVDFSSFKESYARNKTSNTIPFNWDSDWAKLYLGGKRHRHSMTYPQFAQMLRGLQGERVRQAFLHFDQNDDGYIDPEDFQRIIQETAAHKLSDHLLTNLPTLCNISPGSKISYANVRAFQNVIREMDLVELVIRNAINKSDDGKITRVDFLNEAARITRFTLFTPMEADILFHFASLDQPSGRLGLLDFARVLDASWHHTGADLDAPTGITAAAEKAVASSETFAHDLLVSAHHFGLGAIAGAFGAFMVYPIDLVKTRMQNQRAARVGQMLYKNSWDCATKVVRNEGFRGLYSGVLPQLVGVAPEKAIKLTVNDLVRGKFTDIKTGAIPLRLEMLAGASAGMCQVIFTNPLEIVKIRLQVQGEAMKAAARDGEAIPKRSAMWIVRHLGILGLYKGASACMLRDAPFSAIYFPCYAHLKRDFFGESPTKKLGVLQLLTAGAIAGMPAAYLTTPADVIKTRLQVEARKGESTYNGIRDAARQIYREEGFKAFFKGGPARILRSSPQFGFTLAGYEVLQGMLPLHGEAKEEVGLRGGLEPMTGLTEAKSSLPYLRSRNALKIILDLDLGFGRVKAAEGAGKWLPSLRGGLAASVEPKA